MGAPKLIPMKILPYKLRTTTDNLTRNPQIGIKKS